MNVREVDPYAVNASGENERKSDLNISGIEGSVAKQGVIEPPLVRERTGTDDAEVPYEVVVGQRRVFAAQSAGLDGIPVVVVGWDDAEALEASITENIDAFRDSVAPKDRAAAIFRLMQMKDLDQRQVADRLGIHARTVSHWLEYLREEWEGTQIHVDSTSSGEDDLQINTFLNSDADKTRYVRDVRRATGGGSSGEEFIKRAHAEGLNQDEVQEVATQVSRGSGVEEAFKSVVESRPQRGETKAHIRFTLSGDEADALTKAAETRGVTENQVVRAELVRYLNAEGFL
jgi:ParB/RepB/Spo0J family partition protein